MSNPQMMVNNLQLPPALALALISGKWLSRGHKNSGRWTEQKHIELFKAVFTRVKYPIPALFDFESMVIESNFEESAEENLMYFVGKKSDVFPPGDIDVSKAVLIGEVEPDSFIALDYRRVVPSVIYYCNTNGFEWHWVTATDSIEEFLERLQLA